jgi:hypothetical protein
MKKRLEDFQPLFIVDRHLQAGKEPARKPIT